MREQRKIIILFLALLCAMFVFVPVRAHAEDFEVTGTFDQEDARLFLGFINEFRTGDEAYYKSESDPDVLVYVQCDELVYDYDLEQIAMQRAIEAAISFEHTRPDGTRCFTATYNGTQSYGENIAAGYGSAYAAHVAFREDNEDYDGQGHRRNMLVPGYKAVGAACFEYNGIRFYAQEFSYYVKNTSETTPLKGEGTRTVTLDISRFSLSGWTGWYRPTLHVSYTEERELPEVALCLATSETFGGGLILPKSAYTCTWVSDTPEIVSVAGGKYRGVGAGQGNIAAQFSYNNMSYTENYDVRVASIDIDDYCSVETIPDQPYTGGAVTPDVTVTFNGSVLEKDKDYTLSYQNNVGPGSAYAVITGQGNFRGSTWQYFYIPAPTSTPTPTKAPTSTPTPTKAPTSTPTPTQAPTQAPTKAPTSTPTPTKAPTSTPTPTQAPTKAPTSTPTPTKAPTSTPTPTQAPTQAPTSTPTPTQAPTKTPIDTPTPTLTRAPTNTPTPTPTQAPTQAPTDTPTDTPAPTPTKTPQATQPPAESAQKPGKPDDESEVPAGVWIIIGLGAAISIGGTAGILLFRKK